MTGSRSFPKVAIRHLRQQSHATESACQAALEQTDGNLMHALRILMPETKVAEYHDIYYLGWYARIRDPDRDLPVLLPEPRPLGDEYAMVTNMNGQPCIPPFRDSNEFGDILGELYFATDYPIGWEDREKYELPTIQGLLMQASDRIRAKLRRSKIKDRAMFLEAALQAVDTARDAYFNGQYEEGSTSIWTAVHAMEKAKKIRRPSNPRHVDE